MIFVLKMKLKYVFYIIKIPHPIFNAIFKAGFMLFYLIYSKKKKKKATILICSNPNFIWFWKYLFSLKSDEMVGANPY